MARKKASAIGDLNQLGKKIFSLAPEGIKKNAIAEIIEIDESRFGRCMDPAKNAKLTVPQLLKLSRYLEVSMEYLADDSIPVQPSIPKDEKGKKETVRSIILKIGLDVAIERLVAIPEGEKQRGGVGRKVGSAETETEKKHG